MDRSSEKPIYIKRIYQVKAEGVLLPGLTILFVALKLTGYIDWSWLWVLSPMLICLIPLAIVLLLGLGMLVAAGCVYLFGGRSKGSTRMFTRAWPRRSKAEE